MSQFHEVGISKRNQYGENKQKTCFENLISDSSLKIFQAKQVVVYQAPLQLWFSNLHGVRFRSSRCGFRRPKLEWNSANPNDYKCEDNEWLLQSPIRKAVPATDTISLHVHFLPFHVPTLNRCYQEEDTFNRNQRGGVITLRHFCFFQIAGRVANVPKSER